MRLNARSIALWIVAACSFHTNGSKSGDAGGDGRAVDGPKQFLDAPKQLLDGMSACPAGYVAMGGSSYKLYTTAADWPTAEARCESDGAGTHLVILDQANELATVDAISSATKWLGSSDRITAGVWKWVDGTSAPSLDTQGPNCDERYAGAGGGTPRQQSSGCTGGMSSYQYVCECDGHAPDHAAF